VQQMEMVGCMSGKCEDQKGQRHSNAAHPVIFVLEIVIFRHEARSDQYYLDQQKTTVLNCLPDDVYGNLQ